MKSLVTKLLGLLLDKLKAKNSLVFVIIQSALIAIYVAMTQGVEGGIIPDIPVVVESIEWLAMILMALIGSNTVTDLPTNYDPGNLKETLAKIIDAFKANNPRVFLIIQTILLVAFAVLTYGGFALNATLTTILQVVTMAGVILTGSRTVKFIVPEDEAMHYRAQKDPPLEFFD